MSEPLTSSTVADGVAVRLRCSVVVLSRGSVLLLHRTDHPRDDTSGDWVLPGGSPRSGESMQACAIRETREETGVAVTVGRCLFVYEVATPDAGPRTVELVFSASPTGSVEPQTIERHRHAQLVPLDRLRELRLRPPLAGHLASAVRRPGSGALYLGNMWRPDLASPAGT